MTWNTCDQMLTLMHALVCSISSLRLSLFLFAKLDDAHTHTPQTHTHIHTSHKHLYIID